MLAEEKCATCNPEHFLKLYITANLQIEIRDTANASASLRFDTNNNVTNQN